MTPLARWVDHLAPGHGDVVQRALAGVPRRTVYADPVGVALDDDDRAWLSAEFSVRARGTGVSAGRLAYTLAADALVPGQLTQVLNALQPGASGAAGAWVEQVRRAHPTSVDVLVGVDATSEGSLRTKLYLLRDPARPVGAFMEHALGVARACGVPASWLEGVVTAAGVDLGFVAVDLFVGAPPRMKAYVSPPSREATADVLQALGHPELHAPLGEVPDDASTNPGRWVVSVRAQGRQPVDTTLHAHVGALGERLPALLGPTLAEAYGALEDDAARLVGRRLVPSYLSWMGPARTLYYQVAAGPGGRVS